MATHHETGHILDTAELDDPVGSLVDFYRGNGYEFETRAPTTQQPRDTDCAGVADPVHLVRGRRGNSWWSSNMSELFTRLTIQDCDRSVEISYEVEVSGQILNDTERAFWPREHAAAERYMRNPGAKVDDLRIAETARADEKSNTVLSFGLWSAIAIFMIIIFLGFVGII